MRTESTSDWLQHKPQLLSIWDSTPEFLSVIVAVQCDIEARTFISLEFYHSVLTAGPKLRLGGQTGAPSCDRVSGPLLARPITKYLTHSNLLLGLSFKIPIRKLPNSAYPSGRAFWDVGLRPLACWNCGFEFHWGHWCLSVVSIVLLGRGLCDELITRPEESYRPWCIVVCDLETSWITRPWPTGAVAPKTSRKFPNSNLVL